MKKLLALITAFTVAFSIQPAFAQGQNCGARPAVLSVLAERYGESRHFVGLAPESRLVEVFGNLETGSWTITVTLPDGMMCLVSSGGAFEVLNEPLGPSGDDL